MRSRHVRRPLAEINVVPYVDVVLVLLVIFMVTAPVMTQGIKVDLPDSSADSLEVDDELAVLILTIQADGSLLMNVGSDEAQSVSESAVVELARRVITANPSIQVLIEGDHTLAYGTVITAMSLLQQAGAEQVGLITEPPEEV